MIGIAKTIGRIIAVLVDIGVIEREQAVWILEPLKDNTERREKIMAHYIDIDKIEYRKGVFLDSEENPLPIIHKVATIEVIRDWTPKADVVERSKIDKAIAQLEEEKEFAYVDFDEYNEGVLSYDDTDICERDACYIGLTRAIEIIKRNIGE